MVLHTPLDYPIRTNSDGTQLRQRKQLPPLASTPTELSMETVGGGASSPSSSDPLASDDATSSTTSASTKTDDAQLLRLHAQFARAFKLNDAAQLLPFLDKDVVLSTLEGQTVRGASAVLGALVGPKMSKLSGGVHVKQARATRCGDGQSAFVYEHGLVFKEPLYSEVVDWKRDAWGGYVATRITHTRLGSHPESSSCPSKSVADVAKVVAALPHRLSSSGDEDDHSASSSPPASRRASLSGGATVAALRDNQETQKIGAVVTRVAVATKLSPIRKRKLVNAFLTVETLDGAVLWKSSVAKKQLLPVWKGIDLECPPPLDEPVVVTLWDYSLFRSLRVATAHTSPAQLLRDERAGLASLELKSMGLSSSSVELTFSITRLSDDRTWRPRSMSVVSTVAAVDAAMADYDENEHTNSTTAFVRKSSLAQLPLEMFNLESAWLMGTSALGVLLVCVALLWLHSNSQPVAK